MKKTLATALALALVALAAPAVAAEGPADEAISCVKTQVKNTLQGTVWMCELSAKAAAPDPVGTVVFVVRCVGDALQGASCHGAATATALPAEGLVACTKETVREVAQGTVQGCSVQASADLAFAEASADPVECVKGGVRALWDALVNGVYEPYACG